MALQNKTKVKIPICISTRHGKPKKRAMEPAALLMSSFKKRKKEEENDGTEQLAKEGAVEGKYSCMERVPDLKREKKKG